MNLTENLEVFKMPNKLKSVFKQAQDWSDFNDENKRSLHERKRRLF